MTEILRIARVREPLAPRFIDEAREVYSNLQKEISYPPPCICPACLFYQYRNYQRGAGPPFSKETFFLDWLSGEIKFSMIKVTTAYVGKEVEGKKYYDLREYFRVRGYIPETVRFLLKHKNQFPGIGNISPGRIKLSLWRFKKSGIMLKLEKERESQDPTLSAREKAAAPLWNSMKFARRVNDFIRSRPGKKASYRQILRHFSNKRKSDLEDVLRALRRNYKMKIIRRGASSMLVYSPPSIESVRTYVKEKVLEIVEDEKKLFGAEIKYKKSKYDNF